MNSAMIGPVDRPPGAPDVELGDVEGGHSYPAMSAWARTWSACRRTSSSPSIGVALAELRGAIGAHVARADRGGPAAQVVAIGRDRDRAGDAHEGVRRALVVDAQRGDPVAGQRAALDRVRAGVEDEVVAVEHEPDRHHVRAGRRGASWRACRCACPRSRRRATRRRPWCGAWREDTGHERPAPGPLRRAARAVLHAHRGRRRARRGALPGPRLIDLGRGNPDLPPPPVALDALQAELEASGGMHGYPPFQGRAELREAIAAHYRADHGVKLDPEREVAVVPGTKTAIMLAVLACAGAGEAVALPDPGYPDYLSAVALARRARRRAAARRRGRLAARLRRAGRRARRRSRSSTTPPTRARRARRRARSRPPSRGRTSAAAGCSTTSPTPSWPSTGAARAACSRSTAPARSPSSCGRRRRSTAWPAGGWASRSATPSSWGASACCSTTSPPACRWRSSSASWRR